MICSKCGAPMEENMKFCPSCGTQTPAPAEPQAQPYAEAPAPGEPQVQPYAEAPAPAEPQVQPYTGTPVYPAPPAQPYADGTAPVADTTQYKLGWYHFCIYFALFAGALVQIVNAFRLFAGLDYISSGYEPEQVYAIFSSLKMVDMLFGALFIAMAVFVIVTRFLLAKLKKVGPLCLYICSGLSIILSLSYSLIDC